MFGAGPVEGTVGVIFGGPSPEHDVSILTGLQAARALVLAGHQVSSVEAIYWTKGERFVAVDPTLEAEAFVDGAPKGARELRFLAQPGGGFFVVKPGVLGGGKERRLELNALINCCHGARGRTAHFSRRSTWLGSPIRALLRQELRCAWTSWRSGRSQRPPACRRFRASWSWPVSRLPRGTAPRAYIIKPRFGGSSIGIEVIDKWADVLRYVELGGPHTQRGVIAEPYHSGAFDVNVAVRAYPALTFSLFERPLRAVGSSPILSYSDKYLGGEGMVSAPRELPAQLDAGLEKELQDAAWRIASVAGARGIWRIDFLVEGAATWWVNEVNTVPGSFAKYLWVGAATVEFPALLADMVAEARDRPSVQWSSMGADGSALRSAASIANKLG